jgi:hypothetical protein
MFVKKFKKKCGVRGCKNISDVYILSRRREMGNTVAMCRDCMVDALKATDGYLEPKKPKAVQKPLFPHPELEVENDVAISSVADIERPEPTEVIESDAEGKPIESVTEDTVTTDFFAEIEKEPTKTVVSPKPKSVNKKSSKSAKKKK